ncbi:unnamed protein product [Victoria cruziana]
MSKAGERRRSSKRNSAQGIFSLSFPFFFQVLLLLLFVSILFVFFPFPKHPSRFFRVVSTLESWWSSFSRIILFKSGEHTCKCCSSKRSGRKPLDQQPIHRRSPPSMALARG